MRLCESAVLLLLLAVTWTKAAPSPAPAAEECSKLDTLKDKSKVFGRFHFSMGFSDTDVFRTLLGLTSSVWYNVSQTQTGISLTQFAKMNGVCLKSTAYVTITGDMGKVEMYGMTREFELLIFSNTSLVMDLRATTPNITNTLHQLRLEQTLGLDADEVLRGHSIYLISRESEPSEADMQKFRAYAKCAGFTDEPGFIHSQDEGYCAEEESFMMPGDM